MQGRAIVMGVFVLLLGATIAAPVLADPVLKDPLPGGASINSSSSEGIKNPLEQGGISTVTQLLGKVINWMLGLVGFIALIALITGGARMIMDFGNEEQVKKGKTTVLWAVIGLLVVILSYAIINIVTGEILGGGQSQTQEYGGP